MIHCKEFINKIYSNRLEIEVEMAALNMQNVLALGPINRDRRSNSDPMLPEKIQQKVSLLFNFSPSPDTAISPRPSPMLSDAPSRDDLKMISSWNIRAPLPANKKLVNARPQSAPPEIDRRIGELFHRGPAKHIKAPPPTPFKN